jgi:Fe2+ or Zn2+ uptake regulation protein
MDRGRGRGEHVPLAKAGGAVSEVNEKDAVHAGHYCCDACNGVFKMGWSEEEAAAEAEENFPELRVEDRAIVCDDCFNRMMGRS